jgi:two-component system chemotaxis sensor kinase CheA
VTHTVDVREFLQGFLGEADEHLGRITGNLAAIERAAGRSHARELSELFRSLHTLKGLAGMMGIDAVVDIAHAMETLVRDAERRQHTLPSAALDPLVEGAKAIAQSIRALAEGVAVPSAPEALLSALERLASAPFDGSPASAPARLVGLDPGIADKLTAAEREELDRARERGERILQVVFIPSTEKAGAGITINTVRSGIAQHGRIVRVLPRAVPGSAHAPGGLEFLILVVSASAPADVAAAAGIDAGDVNALDLVSESVAVAMPDDDAFDRASRKGMVRMEVAKLDTALEHISAIGLGRLRIRDEVQSLMASGLDLRRLLALVDDESRQLRRMRETLLALRMVPLREVLEPLPLIVRSLRNTTGKHLQLSLDVGDTELDKTVAERLFPALVHLVRNAVDHGIEDAETRRARGKPDDGVVRVEASSTSSAMLEISICDDGGGIDPAAVAYRANKPVPRDAAALLDIVTAPGFSIRDNATTTSGRGLGLDIVRHTMEALGGSLELENRPGQGTTWRMRAPLTIAIVDAFAFEAGRERYLAPISVVDAIIEIDPAHVVRPPARADDEAVGLLHARGDVMPLASLRQALGLSRWAEEETKAMIVRRAGARFAFGIARMLGRHEVLVRPLGDPLVRVPGVTGSADLGDGRPTLVLDLPGLTGRLARLVPGPRGEVHQ